MAAIERKINGTFAPVPGGYAQQINEQTTLFVPDFSAARYDPKTGEVSSGYRESGYLPVTTAANDMDAIRASGLELTDDYFEAWYQATLAQLQQYEG